MYKGVGYLRWMGRGLIALPRRLKTAWISSKWMRKKLYNNLKYIIKHPATEIAIGTIGLTFCIGIILISAFYLASRSCFVDAFFTTRTWSFIGIVPSFFLTTHGIYRFEVDC